MAAALSLKGLTKSYRAGVDALHELSLEVMPGEAFGFVGPNGAGKSTTIRMIMGIMRQTRGSVAIFGLPAAEPEARLRVGYVPENPSLYDFLTPREILEMSLGLHRVRVDHVRTHCLEWLRRFDLHGVADKTLRTFSKGMCQRVALAQAMCIQPRLLVLDEPLSGLDPVGRRDVVEMLYEYKRGGGTIFFSSHVLHDVERLADQFGLLHKGRLLTVRSPQELAADRAGEYVVHYRAASPVPNSEEIRPGLYTLAGRAETLPSLIELVLASGGVISEVQPRVSLESVFFGAIGAGVPGV